MVTEGQEKQEGYKILAGQLFCLQASGPLPGCPLVCQRGGEGSSQHSFSLGCWWWAQVLDEVERRRGISAALVYPFMRSLMESPFPAPGKTIKVKTFLPGAGNEVGIAAAFISDLGLGLEKSLASPSAVSGGCRTRPFLAHCVCTPSQ